MLYPDISCLISPRHSNLTFSSDDGEMSEYERDKTISTVAWLNDSYSVQTNAVTNDDASSTTRSDPETTPTQTLNMLNDSDNSSEESDVETPRKRMRTRGGRPRCPAGRSIRARGGGIRTHGGSNGTRGVLCVVWVCASINALKYIILKKTSP